MSANQLENEDEAGDWKSRALNFEIFETNNKNIPWGHLLSPSPPALLCESISSPCPTSNFFWKCVHRVGIRK